MKTWILLGVYLLVITVTFSGQTDARPRRRTKKNNIIDNVAKSVAGSVENSIDKVKKKAEYAGQAARGAGEMAKSYIEMRITNSGSKGYIEGSDKYFHAKGNYNAQKHGPGGLKAAQVISDTRENVQMFLGGSPADSEADQKANKLGQSGGDIRKIRPKDIPPWFRK